MGGAAPKAHALDALALDAELDALLRARWDGVCAHGGSVLCSKLQPELHALLRAALWYFSSYAGSATPGQALQGLHCAAGAALPAALQRTGTALERPPPRGLAVRAPAHSVPRARRLLLGALVVLVPWAWARASRFASDPEHPERLRWWRRMRRAEGAVALCSLLVSLRFLRDGRHPTLPMALLGLRLVATVPSAYRPPVFEFMEQQLVWRSIADTAVAARALIHAGGRAAPTPANAAAVAAAAPPATRGPREVVRQWLGLCRSEDGERDDAPTCTSGCALCGTTPPHTPQLARCGHAFCYFCFASARLASSRARCPSCSAWLREPLEQPP